MRRHFTNSHPNSIDNLQKSYFGSKEDYRLFQNFVLVNTLRKHHLIKSEQYFSLELILASPDFVFGFSSYDGHLFKPKGVWNTSALLLLKVKYPRLI
jgi:hypothetical protein